MKKSLLIILVLAIAINLFFSSCSSTTLIQSTPEGAKVFVNGESVGITPYSHTDSKIVGTTTSIRLEKDGYLPLNAAFSRNEEVDVGAIIGGFIVGIPFLWIMKYKPLHTYELQEASGRTAFREGLVPGTKAEQLRELEALYRDNLITEDEFKTLRKKVLGLPETPQN